MRSLPPLAWPDIELSASPMRNSSSPSPPKMASLPPRPVPSICPASPTTMSTPPKPKSWSLPPVPDDKHLSVVGKALDIAERVRVAEDDVVLGGRAEEEVVLTRKVVGTADQ